MVSKRLVLRATCSLHTGYWIITFCAFVAAARAAPWHAPAFWAALLLAYGCYYFLSSGVCTAAVHGSSQNTFHRRAHAHLTTLQGRGYLPTPYLLNGNLCTLYAALGRPALNAERPYDRESVAGLYPDGERCVLDWSYAVPATTAKWTTAPAAPWDAALPATSGTATPVVILFHGLTGGSADMNVLYVTRHLNLNGMHAVVPVRRGCCEGTISAQTALPKHYEYGALEDTEYAVHYIARKMAGHPILAVGLSAGANILCNYLGLAGRSSKIVGAVSVGNGYCWASGTKNLQAHHPVWDAIMSGMVHQTLFKRFHETVVTLATPPASPVLPTPAASGGDAVRSPATPTSSSSSSSGGLTNDVTIASVTFLKRTYSMREYDEAVSRRLHGFPSLDSFYRHQSCIHRLDTIAVPTVFLNALDDPLVLPSAIPQALIRGNPKALLVTTSSGGHLGWPESWWPFKRMASWMDRFILEGLEAALEEHRAGAAAAA